MVLKQRRHSGSDASGGGATGGGSAGSRLTSKQRDQQRRRQRALELRSEGKTLAEIADVLGWSRPSGVSYALKMARKELREAAPVEDLEMLRRINYARYEELFSRIYPLALGGIRDGVRIPPSAKHSRLALRIIADENALMGLNVGPEEVMAWTPQGMTEPGAGEDAGAVIVVDFDMEAYDAALRRAAGEANDRLVAVDDQPPAGYIAPRPSDDADEPEEMVFEPNSFDIVTGRPIFDPRVALKPK